MAPWLTAALSGEDARAADFSGREGTAEFQYIETLVYARPAGLAGAYTSLARAEDAIGYNPAGLSKLESARSFSGTLRYHMLDVTSGNVTYAFPWYGGLPFAFSAAYVNYGRIAEMDENGQATGREFIPTSFNPSLTAAGRWSDNLRLGVTLKALSEYLGDFEGSTLAWGWGVDAGLLYQPAAKNVGFGLALLNVGRKQTPQFAGGETGGLLPASLKGGFFYQPTDWPKSRVAVDLELPWHDAPLLAGGVEYEYLPSLTLRLGSRFDWNEAQYYYYKATDQQPGQLQGGNALKLAGGFTFRADGVAVDYAAQYWLDLSWVHALTVRYALM